MTMHDPLDRGPPGLKAWHEFQLTFSTALLLSWLFRDLQDIEPEYAERLWGRLQSSICDYPDLLRAENEGQFDGYVPLHNHDGSDILFWARDQALADLCETLFPFGPKEAALDVPALGLTVVGLHGALESYARSVGVSMRGSLPEAIREFLASQKPAVTIESQTFDSLAEADATRHVVVHNRGIVDEAFIRKVRNPQINPGERRVLRFADVDRFGHAILETARALRIASDSAPAT